MTQIEHAIPRLGRDGGNPATGEEAT